MGDATPGQDNNEPKGIIAVRLEWGSTEDIPTVYANQVLITHTMGEFFIIFGEVTPPLLLDDKAQIPDSLKVKPVAKIAISHNNMLSIAAAIQQNVQGFLDQIGKSEGTE